MAYLRLLPPGFVFIDNAGLPLDSGLVYTYATNTTTPKTTYTDITGGTSNANPVVLDSDGRADIWLSADALYRVVVKTSDGDTLDTVDGVTGPLDMTGDMQFYGNIILSDNKGIIDIDGNEWIKFRKVASAVNYIELYNAATGNSPRIQAAGSDSSVGINLRVQGSAGYFDWQDHNGNTIMKLGPGVASSVNYWAFTNGATGTSPTVTATGSDANLDLNFQNKGAGVYNFKGTASNATILRLFEDTDNGTNYTGFRAAASLAASFDYTLPSADGVSGAVLVTDGAHVLSWATGTLAAAATQAEMETATSTTVFVSPGRVLYHPNVPKCWALLQGSGTPAILAGSGVTSITKNATGDYTLTLTTAFSSANWAFFFSTSSNPGFSSRNPKESVIANIWPSSVDTRAAGTIRFFTTQTDADFNWNTDQISFMGMGDFT